MKILRYNEFLNLKAFETSSGVVDSDKKPRDYRWSGRDMTVSGDPIHWHYNETPRGKRKAFNTEEELKAKKRERKNKSLRDKEARRNIDILLNNDVATFSKNTKTPGKAG